MSLGNSTDTISAGVVGKELSGEAITAGRGEDALADLASGGRIWVVDMTLAGFWRHNEMSRQWEKFESKCCVG